MISPGSILSFFGGPSGSGFDELLRLIGIAAIVHAFFKGVKSLAAKPLSPVAAAAPTTPVSSPASGFAAEDEAIAPEIIAAIAAAVASFTDTTHRIVSIKRQSTTWEKVGRQSVLSSHRIR